MSGQAISWINETKGPSSTGERGLRSYVGGRMDISTTGLKKSDPAKTSPGSTVDPRDNREEPIELERNFISSVQLATEAAADQPNEQPLPAAEGPARVALREQLDGVVTHVSDKQVEVECFTDNGSVHLVFPKALVPVELAKYGKPVSISVVQVNGFKAPRFAPRHVTNLPLQDEFEELRRWAETLPND